jgi:type II secretory pathway component PulF
MAVFEYTAKDGSGHKLTGTYDDVDSVAVLREELSKMGYVLIKARRQKTTTKKRRRISSRKLLLLSITLRRCIRQDCQSRGALRC